MLGKLRPHVSKEGVGTWASEQIRHCRDRSGTLGLVSRLILRQRPQWMGLMALARIARVFAVRHRFSLNGRRLPLLMIMIVMIIVMLMMISLRT
jgi:hypothetical protein